MASIYLNRIASEYPSGGKCDVQVE